MGMHAIDTFDRCISTITQRFRCSQFYTVDFERFQDISFMNVYTIVNSFYNIDYKDEKDIRINRSRHGHFESGLFPFFIFRTKKYHHFGLYGGKIRHIRNIRIMITS